MITTRRVLSLVVCALMASTLYAQEAGEKKERKGSAREGVPLLRDLPIVKKVMGKQGRKDVDGVMVQKVPSARTGRSGAEVPLLQDLPIVSRARAEKRIGESRSMALAETGQARLGFGERHLRQRILEVPGVNFVTPIDRIELEVDPEARRTHIPRLPSHNKSVMVKVQRYFRIDADSQDAIRLAEAVIAEHYRADRGQVLFEIQIVTAKEIPFDSPEGQFQVLSEKEAAALPLLLADKSNEDVTSISAPSILVNEGQDAMVSILEEVAYLKDYDVQILGDSAIADPVVDTIKHGFMLNLAAMRDANTGALRIGYGLEQSRLTRPIREFETDLNVRGRKTPVTIQLPEMQYNSTATDEIVLPAKGGTFVQMPKNNLVGDDETRRALIIVKVKPLSVDTAMIDGVVKGYDATEKIAYVSFEGPAKSGVAVTFMREDKHVGQGTIERVAGEIAVVRLKSLKGEKLRLGDRMMVRPR